MDLDTRILLAVAGACIAAVGGLFARVRRNEVRHVAMEPRLSAVEARPSGAGDVAEVREELHAHRLHVSETYVRRDDYVALTATVLTRLDSLGVMVARIDERERLRDRREEPAP